MIECEYILDMRGHRLCKKKAEFIINWGNNPRPLMLSFKDQNFVCEEHLVKVKELMKPQKMEIYRIEGTGRVKVQFT